MLYVILVKASEPIEAGASPTPELQAAMRQYNQALIQAGVRVLAKGLHPSRSAFRIDFDAAHRPSPPTPGPFPLAEVVAGFLLIEVANSYEALDWFQRMPDPQGHGQGRIELYPVIE